MRWYLAYSTSHRSSQIKYMLCTSHGPQIAMSALLSGTVIRKMITL